MSEVFIGNPELADVADPRFKDFFQLWLKLRDEGLATVENEVALAAFTSHFPNMVVLEYNDTRDRYIFRHLGNEVADAIGMPPEVRFLDELPKAFGLMARADWFVKEKNPYYMKGLSVDRGGRTYPRFDVLACPLLNADKDVGAGILLMDASAQTGDTHPD